MAKQTVHVISHTHWDREWYMPFEHHRVKLVELMDTLLDLLQGEAFRSFHLDGQTIMLDDYLQVKPEQEALISRLVREGRLHIGPWYILQDEFLTSGEANVRNLLVGHRDARRFGPVCKIGYFPDSFGNMGQAPQLLRQAGMDVAAFGRGVKPVAFNNEALGSYESSFSEMRWRSPDGSEVLGILFANWYCNGMEIPVGAEEALPYWQERIAAAAQFASTGQILLLNGCDHQPVQQDLPAALDTARMLFPELDIVHSSFPEYVSVLKRELPGDLAVIEGELRSQRTDGWFTLANTASSRVYIKQENQRCQTLLEKTAEPLSVFAALLGKPYPQELLTLSWKTLMQNHPHDSICGCSIDEVHREMMTRFARSSAIAGQITQDSLAYVGGHIDTTVWCRHEGGPAGLPAREDTDGRDEVYPLVVFNTSGWERSGSISCELELRRLPINYSGGQADLISELQTVSLDGLTLVDSSGRVIPATIEDMGVVFGYDLPSDRFRQAYMARKLRVTWQAAGLPALGYAAYALVRWPEAAEHKAQEVHTAESSNQPVLENEWLRVTIHEDGTYDLTDKTACRTFTGLGAYEDAGDIGNEYIFRQPDGDASLTTRGIPAEIIRREHSASRQVYEILHKLSVPVSADERLNQEMLAFVPFQDRQAGRSLEQVTLPLTTLLTLEQGARRLDVQTRVQNTARDHRLRVHFPTDTDTAVHRVDSVFEVALRSNKPAPEWENPSNCQHQQAFVNVSDTGGGLTIANKGLNEYEVLQDARNTVALTLLRSVGELGDWGVFPTPDAQCPGEHILEYSLIPHDAAGRERSMREAYQWQIPLITRQLPVQPGSLPPVQSLIRWSGSDSLALSACKISEDGRSLALRWYNLTDSKAELRIERVLDSELSWQKSSILEEAGEPLKANRAVAVGLAEIVTLLAAIQ